VYDCASARSFDAICAGVPVQAPVEMQSAAVPATCGLAMLVPEIVLYVPAMYVELMHVPGAAIV
jgi:hypothetical protein